MAKKPIKPAMEFEFRGSDLKRLLKTNPEKVLFTIWVEVVTTADGKKVGALRIKATKASVGGVKDDVVIDGYPKPPGI